MRKQFYYWCPVHSSSTCKLFSFCFCSLVLSFVCTFVFLSSCICSFSTSFTSFILPFHLCLIPPPWSTCLPYPLSSLFTGWGLITIANFCTCFLSMFLEENSSLFFGRLIVLIIPLLFSLQQRLLWPWTISIHKILCTGEVPIAALVMNLSSPTVSTHPSPSTLNLNAKLKEFFIRSVTNLHEGCIIT